MADLAADVAGIYHQGNVTIIEFPASAADTFYRGALCFLDATSGKLVTDGIADGDVFVGICTAQVVAAADDLVPVAIDGVWTFPNSNMAIAEAGEFVIHDNSGDSNNPADLDSSTGITEESGVDEVIGTLLWTDGTLAKVHIGNTTVLVA